MKSSVLGWPECPPGTPTIFHLSHFLKFSSSFDALQTSESVWNHLPLPSTKIEAFLALMFFARPHSLPSVSSSKPTSGPCLMHRPWSVLKERRRQGWTGQDFLWGDWDPVPAVSLELPSEYHVVPLSLGSHTQLGTQVFQIENVEMIFQLKSAMRASLAGYRSYAQHQFSCRRRCAWRQSVLW